MDVGRQPGHMDMGLQPGYVGLQPGCTERQPGLQTGHVRLQPGAWSPAHVEQGLYQLGRLSLRFTGTALATGTATCQVEQMAARWEETPPRLPRLVGCAQLDPRAPTPAPSPAPLPTAASLPASSQHSACGGAGSQVGSRGEAAARGANGDGGSSSSSGVGGGGGGGGSGSGGGSVWDAEEEDAEEEEAGGDADPAGAADGVAGSVAGSVAGGPPRRAEVEGTVSGDVSALGGLMGSYARKRVRWADEEAAKDEDFQRTKAGFTLRGAAPLKRQRIRSPPPEDRAEAGDD